MKMHLWILPALFVVVFASNTLAVGLDINQSNYEPAPVQPGKSFDLWLHVKNTSYEVLEDCVLEMAIGYPFSIGAQQTIKELGKINAHQIVLVKYKVSVDPSAGGGTYAMDIRLSSGGTVDRIATVSIEVKGKNPVVDLVEGNVIRASPGHEVEALLKIKNIGSSVANDIIVKVEEDRTVTSGGVVVERQIVPLGATSVYVSSLVAGEEADVEMLLGINSEAELRSYFVPINITYYDQDRNEFTTTAYLGLKVTAQPELDVVLSKVDPVAFPGGRSEMRFDIFNVGGATARYVVVEIRSDSGTIAEPKQFIGTLEADDFDSFRTAITMPPALAAGEYSTTIYISYKDQENQGQTLSKSLQFEVVAAQAGSGDSAFNSLATGVIIAIVLGICYRKRSGIAVLLGRGKPEKK